MSNLDIKKLKKLFYFCLILVIILIVIANKNSKEVEIVSDEETGRTNINATTTDLEISDYNNLSNEEKDYLREIYSGNVVFTEYGVEVYNDSVVYGTLRKIITSTWPNSDMGNFIPKTEYGEINMIEYTDNKIDIYINDAKKGDAKDYLKLLKKYGFTEDEEKREGDRMLQYNIYNKDGDSVNIKYIKESNELQIKAKKNK